MDQRNKVDLHSFHRNVDVLPFIRDERKRFKREKGKKNENYELMWRKAKESKGKKTEKIVQ